jgi:NAD(P)-dependent dehydrogenase (short-subunit alcohol dehydrogenase family)
MQSPPEHLPVVVVTGAAQGIGHAIAKRFAEDECLVVLADFDEAAGVRAAEEIGPQAKFISCDVADETQVNALFKTLVDSHGGIDVLVNNAGIIRDHMIWKMSIKEFDDVIRVNLRGTWLMCREAAKIMRVQESGSIVNIASRAWLGNMGQTNYSASKAGVIGLTRSLALELGRFHVRVNAVAPGLIDTPLTQALAEEVRIKLINAQPTKEMGSPEDVADAVAFLASSRSNFMTGQVLYVDGGKSIGAGI